MFRADKFGGWFSTNPNFFFITVGLNVIKYNLLSAFFISPQVDSATTEATGVTDMDTVTEIVTVEEDEDETMAPSTVTKSTLSTQSTVSPGSQGPSMSTQSSGQVSC